MKFSHEEVCMIEHYEWGLAFDGSSTLSRGGMEVLYAPYGMDVSLSFKLDFLCSNNEVTMNLISALQMEI